MSDEWASHKAYVMGIIGNPYVWIVRCDQCRWLEEAVGPWVDVEEARRQAKAHACDPDIEEKAAEHTAMWADPNYDDLNDEALQGHIDTWFARQDEFVRLRDEAGDSGEGERYQRLIGRSHVRVTEGIREQRRREDRVMRDAEREEDSQCESEDGGGRCEQKSTKEEEAEVRGEVHRNDETGTGDPGPGRGRDPGGAPTGLPPGRTLEILEALEEADGVGIETWSR